MADPRRITDVELERALRDLGPRYPYPPTPNLASPVRLRITARLAAQPRRLELWRDPRRLALVAAVLLVLLGAFWFGLAASICYVLMVLVLRKSYSRLGETRLPVGGPP